MEAKVLFDFAFVDLIEASNNGCRLSSWILDEECITLETASAQCGEIADARLRKSMQQAIMWVDALIPCVPEQTLRRLAVERPGNFENMYLFLGAQDDIDISRVEFFGLWDRDNKEIAYRTRRGFRVQASEGDRAAEYITTRPIDDEPGSLETAAKISLWRDSCIKDHNDSCPTFSAAFVPKRLIEVLDSDGSDCLHLCETQHLAHSPYIPLSYCWGKDQTITSTKATISEWLRSIPYHRLPRTIQDAITVCRNLKVRFLWVDALCIIQDDDRDRPQQIAQMPQIYRNGHMTIAAASASDASKGFLYRRTAPNSETPAFTLPYVCPDSTRGSITIFCLDRTSKPLDTRAWTLQERLLSPRLLEFSEHQVRWLCRGSLDKPGWTNGWVMADEIDSTSKNILPKEVFDRVFDITRSASQRDSKIDLKENKRDWYSLVRAYTHRKLTRPTDRILALSGLAKEYCAALDDEYLAGLWRKSLFTELLWTVEGNTHPAPTSFQGPSWSWTSVNGVIDFKGQYGLEDGKNKQAIRAKILECQPVLVEDGAPFGAVEEDLCSLTLEARLLPALLLPSRASNRYNRPEENHAAVMKMSEDCKVQQIKINLDTSDFRARMPEGAPAEIVLLELYSLFMGSQWRTKGLVLRSEVISSAQKGARERRLAAKEKTDTDISVKDEAGPQSRPSTQTAALRYQFRLYLGAEVDDWSAEQVREYAQSRSGDLLRMPKLGMPTKQDEQRSEPEEQVFYRVGMFDYTSNYWSQKDYDSRAQRECDWFKYSTPRVVKIL
ncbi:hypothetical protein PSPO01_09519 [Paraphaeosphaeria sporulosa]